MIKHLIGLIFLASLLFSCTPKIVVTKSKQHITVNDLSISWRYGNEVNPIYIPTIDSVMRGIIEKFNRKNHSFKIHKAMDSEDVGMTIDFENGKFVSNSQITTSYIVTALGTILTPVLVFHATDSKLILLFWYFPVDKISYTATFSPLVVESKVPLYIDGDIKSGTTFLKKRTRIEKIGRILNNSIYHILYDFDPHTVNNKNIKKN